MSVASQNGTQTSGQGRHTTPPPLNPLGQPPLLPVGDISVWKDSVHSSAFRNGPLDSKRKAIIKDLGRACNIGLDEFIEAYLPRLPNGINDEALDKITGDMNKAKAKRKSFAYTPLASKLSENNFAPLKPLYDNMVKRARPHAKKEPTFDFVLEPNVAPKTNGRPTKTRPDGMGVERGAPTSPYSHYNIAWCEEHKLRAGDEDVQDVSSAS